MSDSQIVEVIKQASNKFHTWTGLVFSLILAAIFAGIVEEFAIPPLIVILNVPPGSSSEHYSSFAKIALYFGLLSAVIAVWVWKRRLPHFDKQKIGILFSSSNSETLANDVQELRERVAQKLKGLDLPNLIELKMMPPNRKIEQIQDAFSAINAAECILLIWGSFQSGRIQGQRHTGFPAINFTYRHPKNVSSEFHQEIGISMQNRKWMYEERNDVIEKSVIASNIAEVALYIVGITLLARGEFKRSEAIFGPLDVALEPLRMRVRTSGHFAHFCTLVRKNRVKAVALQLSNVYNELLWRRNIYQIAADELELWNRKLSEAISLDPQDSRLFGHQAVLGFLGGDIEQALRAAKKAKKLAPRADAIPDFALGFLHVYNRGEEKKGLKHYRVALAKTNVDNLQAIFEIVTFIQQVLDRYPEKILFHYVLGLLNEERLDSEVAGMQYREFIKQSSGRDELEHLVHDAESRLLRIKCEDHRHPFNSASR